MEWYEHLYTKAFIELCGFPSAEETRRQAEFVQKHLKVTAETNLLDLCCGYGRFSHEIAKVSQCQVVGVDLSDEYLAIAREHHAAPEITYIKGDMRQLPFDRQFDAAVNLFTSFGYFETQEEDEHVLGEIRRALRPDGLFLLEYENKFWFVQNDVRYRRRSWMSEDTGTCYLIENDYDVINEREIYTVSIMRDGKIVDRTGYNIRLYSLPELRSMLKSQGFELLQVWGDYEENPYSVDSKRLIVLSRRIA